jgi:predicted nucleic acid-binding protein
MYGIVKEQLRKIGVNIPENDIWIAATAKARNCRLLTYDAHFKSVDGLSVIS